MKKALAVLLIAVLVIIVVLPVTASAYVFLRNLQQGSSGPDVLALQKTLNLNAQTQVSQNGPGSPGQETSFFGAATKKAVIAFQELYRDEILTPSGLVSGNGFVGALTRKKLNSISAAIGSAVSNATQTATSNSGQLIYVPYSNVSGVSVNSATTTATNSAPQMSMEVAANAPVITSLSTTTIANGDRVTITGSNFLPTDTVVVSIDLPDKFANIQTASTTSLQFTFYSTVSAGLKSDLTKFAPRIQSAIVDKIRSKMSAGTGQSDWLMAATIAVKNTNGVSNAIPVKINILKGI